MPYIMKKKKSGKFSVSGPGGVHAKGTTKEKAMAQMRLLHGVEHGMLPRKKKPAKHMPNMSEMPDMSEMHGESNSKTLRKNL